MYLPYEYIAENDKREGRYKSNRQEGNSSEIKSPLLPFVSIPSSEGGIFAIPFLLNISQCSNFAPSPLKHYEAQEHVASETYEIDIVSPENFLDCHGLISTFIIIFIYICLSANVNIH